MATSADESKSNIPLAGCASDGWSTEDEATATCYCGAVQLSFPTRSPGLVDTFVCNCTDCRKITASMFATNCIVADTHLTHVRGRDALRTFSQAQTTVSGKTITNHFCGTCGTLMYRTGGAFPGRAVLRVGTVDDFALHEAALKPRIEQFAKDRVAWLGELRGVERVEGSAYT